MINCTIITVTSLLGDHSAYVKIPFYNVALRTVPKNLFKE